MDIYLLGAFCGKWLFVGLGFGTRSIGQQRTQILELEHSEGAAFALFALFARIENPAQGRAGGSAGAAGRFYLGSGQKLRGKGKQIVPAGETVVLEMPGGAGYGAPGKRDGKASEKDMVNGLVSPTTRAAE